RCTKDLWISQAATRRRTLPAMYVESRKSKVGACNLAFGGAVGPITSRHRLGRVFARCSIRMEASLRDQRQRDGNTRDGFLRRTHRVPLAVAGSCLLVVFCLGVSPHLIAQTPPAKSLLTASDFTFLGGFRLPAAGTWDTAWGRGLTHRYVGGQLR